MNKKYKLIGEVDFDIKDDLGKVDVMKELVLKPFNNNMPNSIIKLSISITKAEEY